MTTETAALEPLADALMDEIAVASQTTPATPLERFVAEALTSDDAKEKGLVDRVWVVSLPDARKAIAAITAWNTRRPSVDPGVVDRVREARTGLVPLARYGEDAVWRPVGKAMNAIDALLSALGEQSK